jgi:hypothetical protein
MLSLKHRHRVVVLSWGAEAITSLMTGKVMTNEYEILDIIDNDY